MTDIVELQRQKIKDLEQQIMLLQKQHLTLIEHNSDISQILVYLTDNDFRDFAFKLNYNRLITDYLENECVGDKWI